MKLHKHQKTMAFVLTATLTFGILSTSSSQAATALKLSEKSVTITVGKSTTITGNKKIKKWKSSNKTVATVKKVTNRKAKITGRKKGSCKITATNGEKTITVKVIVRAKPTATAAPIITSTPLTTATAAPIITNTPSPTTTVAPIITSTPSTMTTPPVATSAPVVTQTPAVTSNPMSTEKPDTSATEIPANSTPPTTTNDPVATKIPTVTTTPTITTNPVITATPSAIETTSPASIIDMNKVQASFSYNGEKICSIQNDNPVDFQFYTNNYYLEQKMDDTWVPLPAIDIYREFTPAVLKANSSISYSVDYLEDYGKLENGTYRIVVPLFYTAPDATEKATYYVYNEFTIEDFSTEKVNVTALELSNKALSITIENSNSVSLQLDQAEYDIEMLKDGQWTPLPSTAILRPNLPMEIEGKATSKFSITYTEYYGLLPAGTYRIVLPICQSGDTNKATVLYAVFSVSE